MQSPDFDDPAVWATEPAVPLLDEHTLSTRDGRGEQAVDRAFLEEVAKNNNARIQATGDWVPAVVGHTKDDAPEDEQPEILAYFGNFRVAPFRNTGRYALYGDMKYERTHKDRLNKYPRRSVELWLSRKEIDPVALLGATTPERDLGILRLSRPTRTDPATGKPDRLVRFRACDDPQDTSPETPTPETASMGDCKPGDKKPTKYDDAETTTTDAKPTDAPTGGSDEMVAKVVASAAFQEAIQNAVGAAVEKFLEGLDDEGGENMGDHPDDLMGAQDEPPPPGTEDQDAAAETTPPAKPGKKTPPPAADEPEDEARVDNEPQPVKLSSTSYGFPSATNTSLPHPAPERTRMSRTTAATAPPVATDDVVVKLSREVDELRKYKAHALEREACYEADKAVAGLKADRVDFGTPEEEKADRDRLVFLYQRNQDAFAADVDRIRKRYQKVERRIDEPTDVLRFSRDPAPAPADPKDVAARAEVAAKLKYERGLSFEDAMTQAATLAAKNGVKAK